MDFNGPKPSKNKNSKMHDDDKFNCAFEHVNRESLSTSLEIFNKEGLHTWCQC